MFSHTLFSLPFATISMLWAVRYAYDPEALLPASGSWPGFLPTPRLVFWIFVALFAARNGANAFNRYADARFDAKNPRTAFRHIPRETISKKETLLLSAALFAVFMIAAFQINRLCFLLSPLALALFLLYSYTKRFTALCHVVLGLACGGAPVGAWLAVTGEFSVIPFIMGAGMTFWVGGFDILYGTLDIAFDRAEGLHSIPAALGINGARIVAAGFHMLAILLLFFLCLFLPLGHLYLVGLVSCSVLLAIEHAMIKPSEPGLMQWVVYHINQIVAVVFFIFAFADLFWNFYIQSTF